MQEHNSGEPYTVRGWANAHTHLDKAGLVPELTYTDVAPSQRAELTRVRKQTFQLADIQSRADAMLSRMAAAGTVYVRTHVDVDPIVGLRGIEALLALREQYTGRMIIEIIAYNQEGFDRFPEVPVLLREALRMGADGLGGHTSIDEDGRLHIDRMLRLALEEGAQRMEFHTDETGHRQDFLLPYLAGRVLDMGIGDRVSAIHCNTLAYVDPAASAAALSLVARAGMSITICPTAIATRRIAPVKKLWEAGVRLELGSDNMQDLFNPLGSCNLLQYAQLLAYTQRLFESRDLERLLRMMSAVPDIPLRGAYQYGVSRPAELIAEAPLPFAFVDGDKQLTMMNT